MANHPYRFTVEDHRGKDVLVYEGTVPKVGKVRVRADGDRVELVYADKDDPERTAPVVLASAVDPGVDLRLRRVALNRQKPGRPIIKDVRRD